MEKIDELDRKILKIITQSARIPFKDVAEQCGVSRAAIHQRVQKMFDNGVITGSSYHVQPKMLGYQLCVYIGITMEKASMYNQVIAALEKIPEVVEAQYTLGAFGLLVKVYARDNEHLLQLLNKKIQEIPGVANTTTMTATTCVEYLRFAQSLNRRQRQLMESTTGREAAILNYVLQTCERFGQTEFVDKYYPDYAAYVK